MSTLRSLFVSTLLLAGCPHGPHVEVKGPPTYGDGNVPSDIYYEELASRVSEMAPEGEIPADPEEALKLAEQKIADLGIRLVPKAPGLEAWDRFTTTFPRTIFVAKDWDTFPVTHQAEVLWHELVHVREYEAHTPLKMGAMYMLAEGRWALEVQAYRESFRVQRLFGVPEDLIQRRMRVRAERIYEFYELENMPRDYVIEKAIEIWMLDSEIP